MLAAGFTSPLAFTVGFGMLGVICLRVPSTHSLILQKDGIYPIGLRAQN